MRTNTTRRVVRVALLATTAVALLLALGLLTTAGMARAMAPRPPGPIPPSTDASSGLRTTRVDVHPRNADAHASDDARLFPGRDPDVRR